MPELPDLVYIKKYLDRSVVGRTITAVQTKQPIVVRTMTKEPIERALTGQEIRKIGIHGPFLRLDTKGGNVLVINLMLAGRLQHQIAREKPEGHLCLTLGLDDRSSLNLCDEEDGQGVLCRAGTSWYNSEIRNTGSRHSFFLVYRGSFSRNSSGEQSQTGARLHQ